jgi:hypothetical protein
MPGIIGPLVQTFEDSILLAHYEAMQVQEVIEFMQASSALCELIRNDMATVHELGGFHSPISEVRVRGWLNRTLGFMPKILGWARRKADEGHPIDPDDIRRFEMAIQATAECLARLDAMVAENAEDPSLPSLDELKRQIAESGAGRVSAAKANAISLFGREVI